MKKLLLLLFVTSWWNLSAQNIDSLTKIVQSENQPDSAKWTASSVLVRYYLYRLPDSAQYFTALRYELAEKTKLPSLMAQALFELGIYNERMGNYEQGLDYLTRSLEMFEEMDNQRFISNVVNSIGAIYSSKRENDSALKYFLRSLEIDEAMGNRGGMAVSYNNVGDVYRNLGDYNQALDYYGKSIRISEELGLRDRMSTPLTNIGFIYSERGDPEQALSYFARSLAICEESGYLSGVGSALAQLGFVSEDLGELDQALDYYTRSVKVFQDLGQQNQLAVVLISMGNVAQKKGEARQARAYYTQSKEIYEALGIWDGLANTLTNLGESYRLEGNLPEAKVYAQEALDIAQAHEIGVLEVFESIYGLMYQVSKAENNPSLALDMHEKYIEIRDSVNREENQRATFRFEYERKALQDSLSFVEQQAQTELGYQQQLAERNYLLLGGLGLALLGGLGFYFWQQRRSREKEILHQKEMLNSTILTQEKERQR
ncbi:MAG: tetratricopeptide repeat protein, partial [Bacteroidota bacterium]